MGTVGTSTAGTATAFGNQRKIDRTSNGVLWAVQNSGSATGLGCSYSTDQGATWTAVAGPAYSGSSATYTPNASLFIDLDDFAHVVYKDRHDGLVYYRRGTPNAARTAYTWSAALVVGNSTGHDFPDLVAFRNPAGGWTAFIVLSQVTSFTSAQWNRVDISSTGTATAASSIPTVLTNYSGTTVPTYPSIDFHHTGDGKTVQGGTPHLYTGWSAGRAGAGFGIRFRKAVYAAGSWTWNAEREIDSARYWVDTGTWLATMFDGTRVVFAGSLWDGANTDLVLHERDAADITTTPRVLIDNSAGTDRFAFGSAGYVSGSQDVWLIGRDLNSQLRTRSWRRSGATLETGTVVDTTSNTPYVSVRRGTAGARVDYVYTDAPATGSVFNVFSGQVVLNAAPTAPVRTAPADNTKIDRALALVLDWDFTDPDTGDTQSAYDLRYRPIGAPTYTTVMGTTATAHTLAAGTLAPGDYEWAVRTYDAQGAVSPWSTTGYFTAANAPAAPTITAPAAGATVPERTDLTWSAPTQDAYQVQRLLTSSSAVLFDTGRVPDPATRARTLTFPTNNVAETLRVRVEVGGLWSAWSSVAVQVAYTPPAAPTVALAAVETIPGAGPDALRITITNPTPGAGQPMVVSHDVLIDHGDSDGLARRATGLPAGQPFTYYLPVSGRDYSGGRVQVVAVAANGTTSLGSS